MIFDRSNIIESFKKMKIIGVIILRFSELKYVFFLISTYFISCFIKKKNLWLISERGFEARDNGYFFFCYLKNNHPEINTKFVLSKDSKDLYKFAQWKDDLVDYGSIEHYLYFWEATHLISTHPMGCSPVKYTSLMKKLHVKFGVFKSKKHIFLQHGIIKDDLPGLYYENLKLDLFICGAKPEYDYVKANFHYSKNEVQYTGLCRYDNLNKFTEKNQILIMPTWRKYIDRSRFEETEYYKHFKELLLDKDFHAILSQYGLTAIFYPHYAFQQCIKSFKKLALPDNIVIADFSYDVQTLLKESKLLISDYSSVYFDMAYMHKPILLYQFDETEYRKNHYKEGYFDVNTICEKYIELSDLIEGIENVINRDFEMLEQHRKNADKLFELRDSNNCDRVYNAITNLSK